MNSLNQENLVTAIAISNDGRKKSVTKKKSERSHTRSKSTTSRSRIHNDSNLVGQQIKDVMIDSQNMEQSPLHVKDIEKEYDRDEKESEGLPVYHDHLTDEVVNHKTPTALKDTIISKMSRDREADGNESRSTQQMFEHQFAKKGRFNSTKRGATNNLGNVNFIGHNHMAAYKPLPPIIQERESTQHMDLNYSPPGPRHIANTKMFANMDIESPRSDALTMNHRQMNNPLNNQMIFQPAPDHHHYD